MTRQKLVRLLKKSPSISPEAFQTRWREGHAALQRKLPGLRGCVQSAALLQGYAKGPMLYDGIDEFWFESADAMRTALASEAWRAIAEDARSFASEQVLAPVDVYVIKDNPIPVPAVKNIEFVNRRQRMDLAAFRKYWCETHGPIACHIPPLVRYEQNHLQLGEYEKGAPALDGLAITWFSSTQDMRAGAKTPEYATTRADEPNFLPDGHLPIIITREFRVF